MCAAWNSLVETVVREPRRAASAASSSPVGGFAQVVALGSVLEPDVPEPGRAQDTADHVRVAERERRPVLVHRFGVGRRSQDRVPDGARPLVVLPGLPDDHRHDLPR